MLALPIGFPRRFISILSGVALVLTVGAAAKAQVPVTGSNATQHVSFAAGANLVSLRVYPNDRNLESIFGDEMKSVLMVKDARGSVFAPSYGVEDLKDWPWREALMVYAREPFAIDVTGPTIAPTSEVRLEAGWSWIPAFADAPAADALASLASVLMRAEDASGHAYPADDGETPLTALQAGRGYRVRLSAPATYAYAPPPDTPPSTPSGTSVPTALDAIAMTGLAVGQEVRIEGFRAPGDGGAGTLRVTDSGCAPDGGTCFVPTEHTAAGEDYSSENSFTLFGDDIQWESFRLCHSTSRTPTDRAATSGDGCFEALQLHGHGASAGGAKVFNAATGRVNISGQMRDYADTYDGSKRYTASFRYSTDTIRLERVVEPMTLEGRSTTDYARPEWWGGRPDHGDATDAVAWALEAAEAKGAETDREAYAVLSGMYGYAGVLETQTNTVLKGARDGVRDGQGLRVMPGAPWHLWALKSGTTAFQEPATERDGLSLGSGIVVVRHGRKSESDRVVDIEIDGNLAQNREVFDEAHRAASGPSSYTGGSEVDHMLQNTSHWNGFVASTAGGDFIVGSRTRLENVHIHDTGGNLWLSGQKMDFGGSHDIRLGNSARNHVAYGIQMALGTSIDRVEVYGFFWKGALEVSQGTWRDVTFTNLVNPPALYTQSHLEALISHRNNGPVAALVHSSTNYYGEDVTFDGVTFDIGRTSPYTAIYYDRGPMTIRNVTVRQSDPSDRLRLVTSRGSDSYTSQFRLDGVTVESGGLGVIALTGRRADVHGLTLPPTTASPVQFVAFTPTYTDVVYTLYGITGVQRSSAPVALNAKTAGASADLFVRDAAFSDNDSHFMFTGADPADRDVQSRYHAYFRRVTFSTFTPVNNDVGRNRDNWRISYYDAVRIGSRRSEDTGTLRAASLSASGTVDVPVNLFYAPFDPSYVTVTGADAGRFTGWTNVGTDRAPILRMAFSGRGPVSVSWTAAVRPIPAGVVFPD